MTFAEIMYKGFLGYYLENNSTESGFVFFSLITLGILVLSVGSYFLGSLNFAIIISKLVYKEDIRNHGSGNAGMTNMLRTYGKLPAACTLLADALKAVVSVLIGRLIFGSIGAYMAGLACVLGHIFPFFYRFKGGKGVVVAFVTVFMTNWRVGLILLAFFVILVAGTKYVSLGSVMCALVYPLLLSRMLKGDPIIVQLFSVVLAVIIVVKHKDNIMRLIRGEENKISFKRKNKENDSNDAGSDA